MLVSRIDKIKIAGLSCALPTRKVANTEYYDLFGQETVDKIIASTGVRESYHVHAQQTAGDLSCAAAKNLLDKLNIDPASIGIVVFVGTYPDYFVPATANVIQMRLGLSTDCLAFDINLACSSFVLGLNTVSALLQTCATQRALFLMGDSTSKVVSGEDKSRLLFGDAGAAVLLEKDPQAGPMDFGVKNDGSRFKAIIVPAGAFRQPDAPREPEKWLDGNIRSDYNLFMNGTDVFSFSMSDVPALIKEFLASRNLTMDTFDAAVFHQPNAFILKHLAKKINLPLDKLPLSLDRYGNTSGPSIAVTLCDAFGQGPDRRLRLLLCGFGVGLSWAVASLDLETGPVLPIVHTDDYFEDGLVAHN